MKRSITVKTVFLAVFVLLVMSMTGMANTVDTEEKRSFSDDPAWIEEYAGSVYQLEVYDAKDTRIAVGSGFAVFDTPVLATACHVIVNMDHVLAYGENGEVYRIDTLLDFDREEDTALLMFPEYAQVLGLPISERQLYRGEKVTAIGTQFGVRNLVTIGNICGIWEDGDASRILFSAPVSGGSSGGPVIDDEGYVIGLVSGCYENGQNLNIAVFADRLSKLYPDELKTEEMK